jgi:hypothetical protein
VEIAAVAALAVILRAWRRHWRLNVIHAAHV